MGKIYTKTGDKGTTGTFLGRMSKADDLAEALGAIDELNSWIGISVLGIRYSVIGIELHNIQTNLMIINSILAGSKKYKFTNSETKKLERLIDKLTKDLPELKNFIYPVGNLQLARAICRRAERGVVKLEQKNKNILKYLNRLSDALFVMGRWVNFKMGITDEVWK